VVLRTKPRAFHAASGHRHGRPNLWKDLQEGGEAVSEKRVARLMREEGIRGRVRRRFKNTTMSDHADPIAPNVLDCDFTAAGPHQRLVGDTKPRRTTARASLHPDRQHAEGRAVNEHGKDGGQEPSHRRQTRARIEHRA
jgi:hypothetical protein